MERPITGKGNLAISGFATNREAQSFDIVRPLVRLRKYKCRLNAALNNMNINITVRGLKKMAKYFKEKGVRPARNTHKDVERTYLLIMA